MSERLRTSSIFRKPVDQSILTENKRLVQIIQRRHVLRGAVSLGALTMLTGCDITNRSAVQGLLTAFSFWNDRFQAWLFDPTRLAPTYTEAEVLKPPRFNAFYGIDEVKHIDASAWKLELAGLINDKKPWTVPDIYALPEQELIIRHICVEGWDYIGQWSGPNLRMFLERIGADLTAKYVAFRCADGYSSSIDMPTALHPQTILATKYAKDPVEPPVRIPAAAAHLDQAGLQEPEMDHGH